MTECLPEAADDVFGPVRHYLEEDSLVQHGLDHVVPATVATRGAGQRAGQGDLATSVSLVLAGKELDNLLLLLNAGFC